MCNGLWETELASRCTRAVGGAKDDTVSIFIKESSGVGCRKCHAGEAGWTNHVRAGSGGGGEEEVAPVTPLPTPSSLPELSVSSSAVTVNGRVFLNCIGVGWGGMPTQRAGRQIYPWNKGGAPLPRTRFPSFFPSLSFFSLLLSLSFSFHLQPCFPFHTDR